MAKTAGGGGRKKSRCSSSIERAPLFCGGGVLRGCNDPVACFGAATLVP